MIELFEVTRPKTARELLGELAVARTLYYEELASRSEKIRETARVVLSVTARTVGHEIPAPSEHDFTLLITDEKDSLRGPALKISGTTTEKAYATITIPDDPDEPARLAVVSPDDNPIVWRGPKPLEQ